MKKSKGLLFAISMLSMLILMTSCQTTTPTKPTNSGTSSTGASSTVENKKFVWATWAIAEDTLKPIYMSMAETFMEANKNVTIETASWPYAQYKDQLIIAAAASNAPDIAHVKAEWIPALMDVGALQALDDVMSSELKSDYYENILQGVTVDGKIMVAPWFNNPLALYYNKTLLSKAGISEPPTTWAEMISDAKKIAALGKDENGNKIYGYALCSSKTIPGEGYNFFPAMWAYGGEFCDEQGNIKIYSPENVKAFEEQKELVSSGVSPNCLSAYDIENLFAQGQLGFFYDLEMAGAKFEQVSPKGADFAKEYAAIVIPSMTSAEGYGYMTEHYLAVFNTAKDLDAIGLFIDHMSGPVVLKILYDAGMGKMPDRASVAKLDIFTNPEKEIKKVFVSAVKTARSLPVMQPHFMEADAEFMDALALISISNDSVDQIVKDLDAKIKELYGQ